MRDSTKGNRKIDSPAIIREPSASHLETSLLFALTDEIIDSALDWRHA